MEYEEVIAQGYTPSRLAFEDWRITEVGAEAAEQGFLFLQPPFPPIHGYFLTERTTGRFLWGDAFLDQFEGLAPITPSTPNFELWITACLRFAPVMATVS